MFKHISILTIATLTISCQSSHLITPLPVKNTTFMLLATAMPSSCSEDMVEIVGDYCSEVEQVCISLDISVHNANGFVKCDEYKSPSKCLSTKRIPMHFCMDSYEWPNKKGTIPEVMVSWNQMAANCKAQGKRICKDVEWTQACEGPEMLPYPYGYKRSSAACNIDHAQIPGFDPGKDVMTPVLVSKLDQRVASGAMPDCVSYYGVHDMTGNVDEATINSSGKPFKNSLKGGAWLWGHRARCRPATIAHNEEFVYYAEGGRCCKDFNE